MKNLLKKINIWTILRYITLYLIVSLGYAISDKTKTINNIDDIITANYLLGFLIGYITFKTNNSYILKETEETK